MIHAPPVTCADLLMHQGVFFLAKNREETLSILVLCDLYNAKQPKLARLTGMLSTTVSKVDTFLDTKVRM
jgi:hypothetical protein